MFTGISNISSIKVQFFFNTKITYSLRYFRAKFREVLSTASHEIRAFPGKLLESYFRNFLTYYACAAFNWVLLVTKENVRIPRFCASISFLTYLCKNISSLRSFMKKNSTDGAGI